MDIDDVIKMRRSIRRFEQKEIGTEVLESLIDCARLAPSGANHQPLEYIIIKDKEIVDRLFVLLNWAGYIAPAGNPPEGYRPTAYIAVLVNTEIRKENYEFDLGAAIENILLSAWSKGIASCWIGNFQRDDVAGLLEVPEHIIPRFIIALGYPAEESVVEVFQGSIKYWKDEQGLFHVPKRSLESILHYTKYSK